MNYFDLMLYFLYGFLYCIHVFFVDEFFNATDVIFVGPLDFIFCVSLD
jgi:hypothetical protein